MMTVQEAYFMWRRHLEGKGYICCSKSHCYFDDRDGFVPKADEDVCERERAWRIYVRLRDNNPNFPFGEFNFH